MRSRLEPLLAACFFVSGATSLVLEVVWAKQLSYTVGNTFHAAATVIAAFMGGLGLGSYLASRLGALRHPIRAYAWLQFGIGLCGALSIPALRATTPAFGLVYRELADLPQLFFATRFAAVFALMLVPVTLMGMSLPLVAGAFARARRRYAAETGFLYGINTLGAVAGTLLAGFALVPALGLERTCLAVGITDAGVGALALWLHARAGGAPPGTARGALSGTAASAAAAPATARARAVGWLYFASGFAAIALEVAWFRYLAFVFGPTAEAFSMMLALFLAGVGFGSLLGAIRARRAASAAVELARLQLGLGVAVLASLALYNRIPEWYGRLYFALPRADSPILADACIAAVVVLPATLLMGAIFPVAVRCFFEASGETSRAEHTVGRLYALNTWGGILGSFAAGFWLLPALGLWQTCLLASGVSALLALGFLSLDSRSLVSQSLVSRSPGVQGPGGGPRRRRRAWIAAAAAALALLAAALPRLDLLALNRGVYMALSNELGFRSMMGADYDATRRLLFYREGVNASVAVTANDGNSGALFLRIAGKPVAGTRLDGRAHLVFLGQLPALLADHPRRGAVIGFGAGITTGSLLTHEEIERVDVIELEGAVLEAARYFAGSNGDPLADPRTRVIVEDARTFLSYVDERYDVVTSDPISPVVAGAANLYTADFYELVRRKLAPGGVFCQWLETWIPSEATYAGILRSVAAVFPHVAIFTVATDSVIVASNDPIELPWSALEARFEEPAVRADFEALGIETPAELLGFFVAGTDSLRGWLAGGDRINTDDDNWVERQMPRDLNRRSRAPLEPALFARFGASRVSELERLAPGLPLGEVVRSAVQPRSNLLLAFSDALIDGFERHFGEVGDQVMLARLGEWKREERTRRKAHLTREAYARLVRAAEQARGQGDRAERERLLRELMQYPFLPRYYDAGISLAKELAADGRSEQALATARLLQQRFPAHGEAFALEIRLLEERGDGEAARRALARALLTNPGDPALLR